MAHKYVVKNIICGYIDISLTSIDVNFGATIFRNIFDHDQKLVKSRSFLRS